jgi:hypothetical protein
MKWNPKLLAAMNSEDMTKNKQAYDILAALRGPDKDPHGSESLTEKDRFTIPIRDWARGCRPPAWAWTGFELLTKERREKFLEAK